MDFWDLTKLLFRRWYIALPLILVTAAVSASVWRSAKPDYTATAYVQLIPPVNLPQDPKSGSGLHNPWLDLGLGSLSTAAIYTTQDQTFLDQLVAEGFSDNIAITTGYPEPIATIQVVAGTRELAIASTDRVVKRYSDTITTLQTDYGASQNSLVSTRRLDQGDNLKTSGGKVKRALVAVAGAGILITVGLTIGFDALIRGRSRRRPSLGQFDGVPMAAPATGPPGPAPTSGDGRQSTPPERTAEVAPPAWPLKPGGSALETPALKPAVAIEYVPQAESSAAAVSTNATNADETEEVRRTGEVPDDYLSAADTTIVLPPMSYRRRSHNDGGKGR